MITLQPPGRLPASADPWDAFEFSEAVLKRFLQRARRKIGLKGDVDVLLGSDSTLRRLNREFRGKDKSTDVLSFTVAEGMPGNRAGDLAISVETAARQADEFDHSVSDEICVLMLHGLLHLSGMDHESDKGEMAGREAQLREALSLPSGLIARAGKATTTPRKAAKAKAKSRADSSAALRNDSQKSKDKREGRSGTSA